MKGYEGPNDRFMDDLKGKTTNALLSAFQVSVNVLFPDIATAAEIHVLEEAILRN